MAAAGKAPREVDDCRCLIKGMAKNLADRCYGPDGPAWGTPFSALEGAALALAASLRKAFLDLALARQAAAFLREPPASLCLCPACGRDTSAKDPEPRLLLCRAATVEWLEPHRHCSKCRKAFFPQSRSLGIDPGQYSPSLLDLVCYAGANKPSFREASIDLDKFSGLAVHEKQVERLCKRIGAERLSERDEQVARFLAMGLAQRKDGAPDGVVPPDKSHVAVVMADAGMLQLRAGEGHSEQTQPADADEAETSDDDADEKPSGRHWREDKVGLVLLMQSKAGETDPCPEIPDTFVDARRVAEIVRGLKKSAALRADDEQQQAEPASEPDGQQEASFAAYEGPKLKQRQVVASRQSWPLFGALLACAAWAAGFAKAPRKAFVADGAKAIWRVWKGRFSSYEPILDFIHAMSYVYAAAKAVGEQAGDGWQLYAGWIRWTWQGEVSLVIAKLQEWQDKNGRPEKGEAETSVRSVVGRALGYLRNNEGKMKYDEYRQKGLPIVSSLVESMVKQISRRVKGTEKFWTDQGAEAILQLRADYLSDGDVMAAFWQRRQAAATGQRSYRPRS
jgi:hypothetical protein